MSILINLHRFLEIPPRDMFNKSAVSSNGGSRDTETYSFPHGLLKPGCSADATNSTKLPSLRSLSSLNAGLSLPSPLAVPCQKQKALFSNACKVLGGFPHFLPWKYKEKCIDGLPVVYDGLSWKCISSLGLVRLLLPQKEWGLLPNFLWGFPQK